MKAYSKVNELPRGKASAHVTDACLVLEGGAFRGVYTNGVIDALMLADVNTACTVGVSAGAMNGINYAAGLIGRAGRVNLLFRQDSRYVGLRALLHDHGVIGFDFAFRGVTETLPFDLEAFLASPRRFGATVTNCLTGEPHTFEKDCGDVYRAIQASASMPVFSRPVVIDGVPYLDGGCSTKIPIDWALDQGYDKIIVVRTRDRSFRRGPEGEGSKRLKRLFFRRYPAFLSALLEENERYNALCDRLDELEAAGRIFVIAPSTPVTVSRLEKDMEKLGALYWQGYRDTEEAIGELKQYLEL